MTFKIHIYFMSHIKSLHYVGLTHFSSSFFDTGESLVSKPPHKAKEGQREGESAGVSFYSSARLRRCVELAETHRILVSLRQDVAARWVHPRLHAAGAFGDPNHTAQRTKSSPASSKR